MPAIASSSLVCLIDTAAINHATSEPTKKASRYHTHWMKKSMSNLLS